MQGFLSYRKSIVTETWIYVGDTKSVEVETIMHFRLLLLLLLLLSTGFYLDLKDTFVVSSFRRNLISISYLDKFNYLCSFGNNVFNLSLNSYIVGTSSLLTYDNLYLFDTIVAYRKSFNMEPCGTKHKIDKLTQEHYDTGAKVIYLRIKLNDLCQMGS